MEKEILKYANGMGAKKEIINWLENNVTKDRPQGEVEHIIDYLIQTKKDFSNVTYNRIGKRAKKWIIELNKKGDKIKEIEGKDVEVIKKWKDGFKFVKLISKNAYKREGFMMGHCVASYYGKEDIIYSLRDKDNKPHATLSSNSMQIKGYGNGMIHPKYIKYNVEMLEKLGLKVREGEMKNLGYINIQEFKKYLSKETIKNLFNKKYHYLKNKLLDKNNEEFACFELLDKIPLIEYNKKNICNINFNLGSFNNNAIKFLFKKLNFLNKNKSNKDSAQIGSSGNSAKIGSSGDSAKIGSSGDSAQIGSSGDSAKIGSSGYSAKIGSSGDSAQIGSSGDSAKIGSSGDSAQIGSSGDYARIKSEGKGVVISGIGIGTMIKAKIGSWITLAEYDKEGKPLFVRSGYIDGIKLKEGIFYKLKNKKFVEVRR